MNTSPVKISHAGGDTIDYRNFRLSVEGNQSVYTYQDHLAGEDDYGEFIPQPDVRKYLGSNQQVVFRSGQTLEAGGYCGTVCDIAGPQFGGSNQMCGNEARPRSHDEMCWNNVDNLMAYGYNVGASGEVGISVSNYFTYGAVAILDPPRAGDGVRVVWEASSGGKTQTLTKYTVQTGYVSGEPRIGRTFS
jgi:hypothetical protein